jgi:hypothetical protein
VAALILLALPLWAEHVEVVSVVPATQFEPWTSALSPDGKKIAFLDDNVGLRMVDLETQKPQDLNVGPTISIRPAFALDGKAIYCAAMEMRNPPLAPDSALFRISLPGGEKKKVLSFVSWFDLSPDGTQILFRHTWDNTEIMIADADGRQPRLLVPASTLKQRNVSWLPSGEVWVVDGTSKENWKIWAVDPHTGERAHPPPRPDVAEIAFVPTRKEGQVPMWGEICRVRNGKVLERLTPESDRTAPQQQFELVTFKVVR